MNRRDLDSLHERESQLVAATQEERTFQMQTNHFMVALAAATVVAAPCFADDFAPPWYRGQPLSVQAAWEFNQPVTGFDIYPDFFNAVGGDGTLFDGFQTKIELDSPNSWAWMPNTGGITPTGPGGASLSFKVQNFVDQMPQKLGRIQFTFDSAVVAFLPPDVFNVAGVIGGQELPGTFGQLQVVDSRHAYVDFTMIPNPWWEHIDVFVPFGTTLDEVVIDTISIPGPGALAILSVAGLMTGGARRRR